MADVEEGSGDEVEADLAGSASPDEAALRGEVMVGIGDLAATRKQMTPKR